MKKNLLITFVALLAIGANVFSQREATIKQTPTAPVIDGMVDDAVWSVVDGHDNNFIVWAKDSEGNKTIENSAEDTPASTYTWKACWDADFLYVSIVCKDEAITRDSPGVFVAANDDGWDIPLGFVEATETANANVTMISINVEEEEVIPTWSGDKGAGFLPTDALARENGAEFANKITDNGWNVEFKYPFKAFEVTIADGTTMQFSVKYNDDNGNLLFDPEDEATNKIGSDREEHTGWGNVAGGWKDPSTFGTVTYSTELLEIPTIALRKSTAPSFSVYPNPANNVITITNAELGANVSVLNMVGQEVMASVVNSVEVELNITNLVSGIYFVKVGDAAQKIVVE